MISVSSVKKAIYGASMAATFAGVKVLAAPCTGTPQDIAQCSLDAVGATDATPLAEQIALVINVLIGLVATAAVIMLVVGGFRYVFSGGEEKGTKAAKDTILYAIIGIVVAILAFSIANFVVGNFE